MDDSPYRHRTCDEAEWHRLFGERTHRQRYDDAEQDALHDRERQRFRRLSLSRDAPYTLVAHERRSRLMIRLADSTPSDGQAGLA